MSKSPIPDPPAPNPPESPPPYEPPRIVWEERYEAVGFGLSCVKQEGNPGCFPGPTFS